MDPSQRLDWQTVLAQEKQQPYFREVLMKVNAARQAGCTIYPPADAIFNALRYTPLAAIKVVILGQDPYHGPKQAHGLCFSVPPSIPVPPSLGNIYKELAQDIPGFQIPRSGCLLPWAEQGVLLLNSVLTVEAGKAHSHAEWGWERLTDQIIRMINEYRQGVVFLLWGAHAQKKGLMIDHGRHCVLKAAHPSPLSAYRGFFGCRHFSQANHYLQANGLKPIDWRLT